MLKLLLGLQVFHVAFLALHDWVPVGRLNDVRAVRRENPGSKLLVTTFVSTVLFVPPLVEGLMHVHGPWPEWVWMWLWWGYGLLFLGEVRAWWWPYLMGAKPERAARYRAMFGRTWAFLPERHGIRPNTLHVMLHAATAATLVVLGFLAR